MDSTPEEAFDRWLHAAQATWTRGLSPISGVATVFDWAAHLTNLPGRRAEIARTAMTDGAALARHLLEHAGESEAPPFISPRPDDHRFDGPEWQRPPFSTTVQWFLTMEKMVEATTKGVEGSNRHDLDMVSFALRQTMDVLSPSNFALSNPEVLMEWQRTGGMNFLRGAWNALEDGQRAMLKQPPAGAEAFSVGETVAVTPGKVILRNRMMELIQYAPTTATVRPEPILITPAWIMKYYILDLSPANSLVKFLVDRGHTVFMISWKNPDESYRDVGLEDYLMEGPVAAMEAIAETCPDRRIHGVGYCLGGTLMAMTAAWLAREERDTLASLTLFAAQTDFTEPGEIQLFIDPGQVAFLKDLMWERGYLEAGQMAGAFQMLRSNDLIWSRVVHDYLMGERRPMNDLMAWNADSTRMPYRMHSEYLELLFLRNALAEGQFPVGGRPVALSDLHLPMFVVGADRDHVAPWRSVFKIGLLAPAELTFLLASGGHNAGIVSEPGHPHRSYRMSTREAGRPWQAPDAWHAQADRVEGSWWPAWADWLAARSGPVESPPPLGIEGTNLAPLCDAPGRYVFGK